MKYKDKLECLDIQIMHHSGNNIVSVSDAFISTKNNFAQKKSTHLTFFPLYLFNIINIFAP